MLFGPIQSSESVSASPHTYFRPRPLPSHFLAPYAYVKAVIISIRPRYLDIWNQRETIDVLRMECSK